jgi:hypothetical protein
VPLVAAIFVKVWLSWGIWAALVVMPVSVLLGLGIGAIAMARQRRR